MRFELFVAWRYLRERGRRSGWWTLGIGALLLVASVVLYKLAARYDHLHPYEIELSQLAWKQNLQVGSLIALVGGVLVCVFGFFHSLQSIFTTISTFGVFLGTAALVIVLSVMNGFEVDLRHKILGSNAHMLVTREDAPFTEWREVQRRIDGLCTTDRAACVVAYTPYVSSEVVVAANSNYQPVIIKGIDPVTVARVTDLERNLSQGSLEKVWPILPDGGVAVGASPAPDAGVPGGGGEDDEEPIDFSGDTAAEVDAGAGPNAPPPPLPRPRPRPLRPDPRVNALDGLLVGRELAKNLRLYEGEEVDVISPLGKDTPAGQVPRTRSFRVAGVFFTGMYEYDAKFVYASIPALQAFLGIGDEVSGIEIKVSDIEETRPLVGALQAELGAGYRVKDWQEINKSLFAALKLEQIAMFLVLTIITLVASFSIVSNLIMVVIEKAREIAILKAMGASDGGIMRVFVAEGLYIGLLGTVFGLGVGLTACWALERFGLPLDSDVYYIDRLPVAVEPLSIVFIAVAGVAISVAATVYPAYVGAKLRPMDGLRQ
jgi:lipoprotein-releasing system permease protein